MKVKLINRKTNKGDKAPFVLEVYKGYSKTDTGKIKHNRQFETLDYYLYKNPTTPHQKQHNKEHKKLAEAVKAKVELELVNGTYGFRSSHKSKLSLIEYFKNLRDERKKSKNNWDNWQGTFKHLQQYCSSHVTLNDIDVDFVAGFKSYLDETAVRSSGEPLSQNTKYSYFNKFRKCINQAFEDGLITENPSKRVKAFRMGEPDREYLTLEEVKSVFKAECRYDVLKRAFLFSCLTGVRWSDIYKMTWKEIREQVGYWEFAFTQQKTKGVEYQPINEEAFKLLGAPRGADERVFAGLKYSSYTNVAIKDWMLKAGITKHITFHCARHTYAILQLGSGTDIYTVSKLLGHRELKTTQIYAKVMDDAKVSAAINLPKIGM